MKKVILTVLALIVITAAAPTAAAQKRHMIFWYPGEAGSAAEAQPLLDEFFAYLRKKDGKLSFGGAYFNTIDEGINFIRRRKPSIGIVSNAVWEDRHAALAGARVLLATRPAPHGATDERYTLVGARTRVPADGSIFTSEPLTAAYVRGKLFADLPETLSLTQTASMFMNLKKIAAGEIEGHAILTPMEAHTLANISSPWKEKLTTVATSAPVPTARVILIGNDFTGSADLAQRLLLMGDDPEAKPILEELRLMGFAQSRE